MTPRGWHDANRAGHVSPIAIPRTAPEIPVPPTMKLDHFAAPAALALLLLATGCAMTTTSQLRIGGTPGADFTATCRADSLAATVSTQAEATPQTVLEFTGSRLEAEIVKKDPGTELNVEIRRGRNQVFQAKAPSGTRGLRIADKAGGWTTEAFK